MRQKLQYFCIFTEYGDKTSRMIQQPHIITVSHFYPITFKCYTGNLGQTSPYLNKIESKNWILYITKQIWWRYHTF